MSSKLRFIDLQPQFLVYVNRGSFRHVDRIEDAQGISFLCPKCFEENHGPVGTHSVICWSSSRGVPEEAIPGPGRWTLEGTGYEDLTLGCEPKKTRSVLLTGGCGWHGFITKGVAHE